MKEIMQRRVVVKRASPTPNVEALGRLPPHPTGYPTGFLTTFAISQSASDVRSSNTSALPIPSSPSMLVMTGKAESVARAAFRRMSENTSDRCSSLNFSKLDFEKEEYDGDRVKFYDYQWFVSLTLLACDEVLRLRGGSDWERIVKNNIRYHLPYINSGKPFQESEEILSRELRSKIEEVREEPKGPPSFKRRRR